MTANVVHQKISLSEQILSFANDNEKTINNLKYGEIKLLVRNGVLYQGLVSESLLVKNKDKTNES